PDGRAHSRGRSGRERMGEAGDRVEGTRRHVGHRRAARGRPQVPRRASRRAASLQGRDEGGRMSEPLTLKIFSNYVCPWCYLSTVRIEKLRTEHNVKIEWVHFPLHPETPVEGRSLADLFAGRGVDRKAMNAQMKARMDAEGLPYGERTMTYNSRLAQE